MKRLSIIGLIFLGAVLLYACGQSAANESFLSLTPTPTLLPASVMTADQAQLSVELTKSAGQGVLSILAIQGTQVSLQLTSAVATEQYFARQTQVSIESTATEEQKQAWASQTAVMAIQMEQQRETETAQANETAMVIAKETATAEYQNSIIFQATSSAIDRQIRSDENTLWFSTWAPRIGLTIIFMLGIAGAIVGGKALYDARWIIAAHLGLVRWGSDGKPYLLAPAFDADGSVEGITFVDPSRMLSSGVTILKGKNEELDQRVSEQTRLQNSLGAQRVDYRLAAGVSSSTSPRLPAESSPAGEAPRLQNSQQPMLPANVKIVVMPPGDQRIAEWVEDATSQIIDGETSD